MTSTSSSLPEVAQAAPTFSYAQAAKGRTPSTTTSIAQPTQNSSGVSTPQKEAVVTNGTSTGTSEKDESSVNGHVDVASYTDPSAAPLSSEAKEVLSSKSVSEIASPSVGAASTSTLPKEDKDDDFVLVGHPDAPTKDRHAQNASERSGEKGDNRRVRKNKKHKNAEKETEEEKEKEEVKQENLVPAPLPTVNFWHQRKEEAAKSKPVQATAPASQVDSSAAKSADLKLRSKDEGNKSSQANGLPKDSSNRAKKGGETAPRSRDEQTPKRAGPRGSRSGNEKDDSQFANQLPPPVEDAISWPTPETALEEDKRKAQEKTEKEEREEPSNNKPRPKEKWVTVPYIPTVTFNTPIPTRGARGRGGARGGRAEGGGRSGAVNGDKSTSTATASTGADGRQSRESGSRAASLPPVANRTQNDQAVPKNSRKASAPSGEKVRHDAKNESISSESRNNQQTSSTDPALATQDGINRDTAKNVKQENVQGGSNDGPLLSRSSRHSDAGLRTSEGQQVPREGRSDRGRGGFRGRGGHNGFANGQNGQHGFANGHPSQFPAGYSMRQNSGPYSPPIPQPPFNNQYPAASNRNARNGNPARSQSIANGSMYGRHYAPPQHISPLQTSNPVFDYPMQPMSAGPYNPYIDSASVVAMVVMQLEYYFSIDNLCKDVYLRKHMDSKGFVFLSFIAAFKRIQSLTQDYELLKAACMQSDIIESVRGDDGHERLRRKEGWEKWVLATEERDEAARHEGPSHTVPLAQVQRMQPMMGPNHFAMGPPSFSPNGMDHMYRGFPNGGVPSVNGNGILHQPQTPLSAAVPDFAPGLLPVNGNHDPLEAETTFSDEAVLKLVVVNRPKAADEVKPQDPFHSFASRTFSNGSIDEDSLVHGNIDDGRQGRPLTNGNHASENSSEDAHRSRSPFTSLSPTKSPTTYNAPPVMWVKGQQQQPLTETDNGELYTSLRSRALKRRENSKSGETHQDMQVLYEFWSHFLVRNFNVTMYHEFRQCAYEDSRREAKHGMMNLIAYYDEVLNSKKRVIPETLARHYIEVVSGEDEVGERPAFQKLRAAWRNGALDLKSRKKIDSLVTAQLREELEGGLTQKVSA